jgi:hypothetical protein
MATVSITLNQLVGRDEALARRFESEIREAAASGPDWNIGCRILAWQRAWDLGSPDLVTVQFHLPGWVKVLAVSIGSSPGDVRKAARQALLPKFSEWGSSASGPLPPAASVAP